MNNTNEIIVIKKSQPQTNVKLFMGFPYLSEEFLKTN